MIALITVTLGSGLRMVAIAGDPITGTYWVLVLGHAILGVGTIIIMLQALAQA